MESNPSIHSDPSTSMDAPLSPNSCIDPLDSTALTERIMRNHQLLAEVVAHDEGRASHSPERSLCPRLPLPGTSHSMRAGHPQPARRPPRGLCFLFEPSQAKLADVDALLARVAQEEAPQEGRKRRPIPQALPQQLKVPLAIRCDFCQRFDSLCSNCHRKWKEVMRQRRRGVACQSYCKLPEERRRALLFMTAAWGIGEFAAMQLEFDGERCLHWQSHFFPLTCSGDDVTTTALQTAFDAAGEVNALHIAFAHNRVDVATTLLSAPRALLVKSSNRVDPIEFLTQPLSGAWEEALNALDVYSCHLLLERAKQLRRMEDWSSAERLYAEVLTRHPDSEHAHCGMAKMLYDQGYVEECVRLCDALLSGKTAVSWNEISSSTVQALRDIAMTRYHDYCHSLSHVGVLKKCGCVILDRVRVSIRKLTFTILVDHIFAFCDGETLWNIFNATHMPLMRTVVEKLTVLLPARHLQQVLEQQSGFDAILVQFSERLSSDTIKLVSPPVRLLGVVVVAMADFNMFLVKAYAAGASTNVAKSSSSSGLSIFGFGRRVSRGSLSGTTVEILISKQYRIDRSSAKGVWRVKETGEWELDQQPVEGVEAQLQQQIQRVTVSQN